MALRVQGGGAAEGGAHAVMQGTAEHPLAYYTKEFPLSFTRQEAGTGFRQCGLAERAGTLGSARTDLISAPGSDSLGNQRQVI